MPRRKFGTLVRAARLNKWKRRHLQADKNPEDPVLHDQDQGDSDVNSELGIVNQHQESMPSKSEPEAEQSSCDPCVMVKPEPEQGNSSISDSDNDIEVSPGPTLNEKLLKSNQQLQMIQPFPRRRIEKTINQKTFYCVYCRARTTKGEKSIAHRQIHKDDIRAGKPFCCEYCPEKFANGKERNCHEDFHTRPCAPWPCKKCTQRFYVGHDLLRHKKMKICYTSEKHFKKHLTPGHSLMRISWICRYCWTEVRETEVLSHFAAHRFCKPIDNCNYCRRISNSSDTTANSVRLHSIPESDLEFKIHCEDCSATFRFHDCLKSHQEKIHGNRYFKCCTCQKEFWFDKTLTTKMRLKSLSYVCRACDPSSHPVNKSSVSQSRKVEVKVECQSRRKQRIQSREGSQVENPYKRVYVQRGCGWKPA